MRPARITAAGAALLLAAGTAACGGSTQAAGNSTRHVVMAVQSLPDTLTIAPWGGAASQLVLSGLGSQLANYDRGTASPDGCGSLPNGVGGLLADSIQVDSAHTAITVHLRSLKSQTGNTLSGDDVKWSFENYGFAAQPVLKKTFEIAGYDTENLVSVVDPHTVSLHVKSWQSYTEEMLQNPLAYVYDSTEAKKHTTGADPIAHSWLSTHLADYSGWKVDSFTPGQTLSVSALAGYGGPKPGIDQLSVQAVPTDATRHQIVASGQAQVASGFQYDQYKALAGAPGVKVHDCAGLNMDNLMLSTKKPPLNDVRVRQAISMAIDRQQIVTGAYFGYAKAAKSSFNAPFGLGTFGDAYTYDQAKAKSLLAEAGYPNGFDLTLTYSPTRPGPVAARTAVLVQSMLKDIGITVTLRPMASPTDFSTAVLGGAYQAVLYGEPVVLADPAYLAWIKFSDSPNNTTGFADPQYDSVRGQLASTPVDQTAKRTELLKQLAQIGDTQVPVIELVETPNFVVTAGGETTAPPLPNGPLRWSGIGG